MLILKLKVHVSVYKRIFSDTCTGVWRAPAVVGDEVSLLTSKVGVGGGHGILAPGDRSTPMTTNVASCELPLANARGL